MNVVIIVQARMSSTRCPGKVLKQVMGRPLLEYQIERLKVVRNVNEVVIATTKNKIDDPIVKLCKKLHCSHFRGSENDVLLRYYEAAMKFDAKCIIRINSDCPLIDPSIVEELVEFYLNNAFDYVSNILDKSYPIGLHTEVFSMKALSNANNNSVNLDEREHVTPYIYRNPHLFKMFSYTLRNDLSNYRWTLDYPEDFELIRLIITKLYPLKTYFDMFDIIELMSLDSRLIKINSQFTKKQTI